MNRRAYIGLFALAVVCVAGCASEAARRATYEAAYQKGCIDSEHRQNCDPEHKSYDEYKESREKPVKPDQE